MFIALGKYTHEQARTLLPDQMLKAKKTLPKFLQFKNLAYIYTIKQQQNNSIMALLKNKDGEYNYQFNWVDENGTGVGFNDVWAPNKRESVKRAKRRESPAKDGQWGRFTGMYVDVKSMYRATAKEANAMNRLGNMMSM